MASALEGLCKQAVRWLVALVGYVQLRLRDEVGRVLWKISMTVYGIGATIASAARNVSHFELLLLSVDLSCEVK